MDARLPWSALPTWSLFLPREHHVTASSFAPGAPVFRLISEHCSQFKQRRVHVPLIAFTHERDAFIGEFDRGGLLDQMATAKFPKQRNREFSRTDQGNLGCEQRILEFCLDRRPSVIKRSSLPAPALVSMLAPHPFHNFGVLTR
jgi:hypothetical protein